MSGALASKPFAFFQWNSGWRCFEQVSESAAGQAGVIAAYLAPGAVMPADIQAAMDERASDPLLKQVEAYLASMEADP